MRQQYLALLLLAMLAAVGASACAVLNPPEPTTVPFARFGAQDVFSAFARASLEMRNPEKALVVQGRGAPGEFSDRYLFEIPRIAPAGGQIIVFADAGQMQAWQAYIDKLRSDSDTRRDVVFTYFNQNVMLQLNPMLTNQEAAAYRDAFMGLE
ncbi:MAG: hypothetical protein IT319_09675 [Anaerolineae bacterium]|nr:hypothetical protein [Anaerolineae bacterium]